MSINGPGEKLLTIKAYDPDAAGTNDGNGGRIFGIEDDSDGTFIDVVIRSLTLTEGDTGGVGGAISNKENLTVADSLIMGNFTAAHGGAIYHIYGTLNIERSTISGNT